MKYVTTIDGAEYTVELIDDNHVSVNGQVFAMDFDSICDQPVYSLLLAYTNDRVAGEDMAGVSGGMLFLNGVGAILGPLATGWLMGLIGPAGFFLFLSTLCATMAVYAAWRMTRTSAPPVEGTGRFPPVLPTATPVAVEVAREVFEAAQDAGAEEAGVVPTPDPRGRSAA